MGFGTLLMGSKEERYNVNFGNLNVMQLSRQKTNNSKHLSYEQTIFNNDKSQELREAKEPLDSLRKDRPPVDSDEYKEWQQNYNDAKEDYEAQKVDINDYYDGIMNELEEESTDEETRITTNSDQIQAYVEYASQMQQSEAQGVSSDIQNSTPKFGG